jgi:DNA replication protein DnaC
MREVGGSEKEAVREFTRPYFLVIDAYEVRGETAFENRILDHVIDLRYDAMKPTLIISNDTPEKFSQSVGLSIIDRIKETGGIVEMNWGSFR